MNLLKETLAPGSLRLQWLNLFGLRINKTFEGHLTSEMQHFLNQTKERFVQTIIHKGIGDEKIRLNTQLREYTASMNNIFKENTEIIHRYTIYERRT